MAPIILGQDSEMGGVLRDALIRPMSGWLLGSLSGGYESRIAAIKEKADSPAEYHELLKREIDNQIEQLQAFGELRAVYDPDGYRYVTLLLYQQDVRERGEAILNIIIRSSLIEHDEQPTDQRSGFILFETPFKKTVVDCIELAKSEDDSDINEQNLVRAWDLLEEIRGFPGSASKLLAIRTTCYDFDAAQRLMAAAGLEGSGPYLLTFDGSYVDRETMKLSPAIALGTACPHRVRDGGYDKAMVVRFRRDPELDGAVVEVLRTILREKDCRTPWLTAVRFEVLDTLVRGSRVAREVAEGMVEIVGIAQADSRGKPQ